MACLWHAKPYALWHANNLCLLARYKAVLVDAPPLFVVGAMTMYYCADNKIIVLLSVAFDT